MDAVSTHNINKTGANVLVIAPPGFVPFTGLQKLCKDKNWDLSYKITQRKNPKPMIRLIAPSMCSIKPKHIKGYTYIVCVDVVTPALVTNFDRIVHSISQAYHEFNDDLGDVQYSKYLFSTFSLQ